MLAQGNERGGAQAHALLARDRRNGRWAPRPVELERDATDRIKVADVLLGLALERGELERAEERAVEALGGGNSECVKGDEEFVNGWVVSACLNLSEVELAPSDPKRV